MQDRVVSLPDTSGAYCLRRARVPVCCLSGVDCRGWDVCVDGLALVDLTVRDGRIQGIAASGNAGMNGHAQENDRALLPELDLAGKMVLPTFVDLHTHIGAPCMGCCRAAFARTQVDPEGACTHVQWPARCISSPGAAAGAAAGREQGRSCFPSLPSCSHRLLDRSSLHQSLSLSTVYFFHTQPPPHPLTRISSPLPPPDKGHTCERSRNPDGSLTGADRSTAEDAAFWDGEDVYRRAEFGLQAAYAHGTSAVRTHLINMTRLQTELTWPVFARLRAAWAGRVELQGVSLVALSFYRDADAARGLADRVAAHGGALGAAVCCAERGGDPADDWTTCEADRGELLDRHACVWLGAGVGGRVGEEGREGGEGVEAAGTRMPGRMRRPSPTGELAVPAGPDFPPLLSWVCRASLPLHTNDTRARAGCLCWPRSGAWTWTSTPTRMGTRPPRACATSPKRPSSMATRAGSCAVTAGRQARGGSVVAEGGGREGRGNRCCDGGGMSASCVG